MYIPKHFEIENSLEIFNFVEANSFGQLISQIEGRIVSTHIPFLLSEDRTTLLGHVAKQNPQHQTIENQEILVSLQGPHDYISPSWYTTAGVPTWNYQAVHIYGTCRVFDDQEKLKGVVDALTRKYESSFETPWVPEYRQGMLHAIVGLEISITEVQCKYKLSQNRSMEDQRQVAQKLDELGSASLSAAMIRTNEQSRI